ncbi:MAG: Holliday junction branch migration protein RuvA [Pseudomonadota bacterium]
MIAKLTGRLDTLLDGAVIIDVGGVGYLVFLSTRALGALPRLGEPVSVWIETHVREDHIHLYGFLTPDEIAWFRLLTAVKGVGPKAAFAIQSVLSSDALRMAILAKDKAAVAQASGVGPRLAERVVMELKDKAASAGGGLVQSAAKPDAASAPPVSVSEVKSDTAAIASLPAAPAPSPATPPREDALSALENLGFARSDAYEALLATEADAGGDIELDDLLRLALKRLAK